MTTALPRIHVPGASARIPAPLALLVAVLLAAAVAVTVLVLRPASVAPAPAAHFSILHSNGDTCAVTRPGTPC